MKSEVEITLLVLHYLLLHTDTEVATIVTGTHFPINVTDSGFGLGFKFGLGLLTFLILQRLPQTLTSAAAFSLFKFTYYFVSV